MSADRTLHVIPILAAITRHSDEIAFPTRVDNSAQLIAQIFNKKLMSPC